MVRKRKRPCKVAGTRHERSLARRVVMVESGEGGRQRVPEDGASSEPEGRAKQREEGEIWK